jgi:hypothetical protein
MSKNRLFIEEMARNVLFRVKLACWLHDIGLYAAVLLIFMGIGGAIAKVVLWVIV